MIDLDRLHGGAANNDVERILIGYILRYRGSIACPVVDIKVPSMSTGS